MHCNLYNSCSLEEVFMPIAFLTHFGESERIL